MKSMIISTIAVAIIIIHVLLFYRKHHNCHLSLLNHHEIIHVIQKVSHIYIFYLLFFACKKKIDNHCCAPSNTELRLTKNSSIQVQNI